MAVVVVGAMAVRLARPGRPWAAGRAGGAHPCPSRLAGAIGQFPWRLVDGGVQVQSSREPYTHVQKSSMKLIISLTTSSFPA